MKATTRTNLVRILALAMAIVMFGSLLMYVAPAENAYAEQAVITDGSQQTSIGDPENADKIFNILLLGTDERLPGTSDRGRADVTMLCSLNMRTGDIKLVSFERGIMVPIPDRGNDLLTHAYKWGGADLSVSLIEDLFDVEIDAYAQADFERFAEVIDILGGIDMELTQLEAIGVSDMVEEDHTGYARLHEGMNHMDGTQALCYCRLRRFDDNWARQERQRKVLAACQVKLNDLSITDATALIRKVVDMIDTDLSIKDLASLLLHVNDFMNGKCTTMQVPENIPGKENVSCDFTAEGERITDFIYRT